MTVTLKNKEKELYNYWHNLATKSGLTENTLNNMYNYLKTNPIHEQKIKGSEMEQKTKISEAYFRASRIMKNNFEDSPDKLKMELALSLQYYFYGYNAMGRNIVNQTVEKLKNGEDIDKIMSPQKQGNETFNVIASQWYQSMKNKYTDPQFHNELKTGTTTLEKQLDMDMPIKKTEEAIEQEKINRQKQETMIDVSKLQNKEEVERIITNLQKEMKNIYKELGNMKILTENMDDLKKLILKQKELMQLKNRLAILEHLTGQKPVNTPKTIEGIDKELDEITELSEKLGPKARSKALLEEWNSLMAERNKLLIEQIKGENITEIEKIYDNINNKLNEINKKANAGSPEFALYKLRWDWLLRDRSALQQIINNQKQSEVKPEPVVQTKPEQEIIAKKEEPVKLMEKPVEKKVVEQEKVKVVDKPVQKSVAEEITKEEMHTRNVNIFDESIELIEMLTENASTYVWDITNKGGKHILTVNDGINKHILNLTDIRNKITNIENAYLLEADMDTLMDVIPEITNKTEDTNYTIQSLNDVKLLENFVETARGDNPENVIIQTIGNRYLFTFNLGHKNINFEINNETMEKNPDTKNEIMSIAQRLTENKPEEIANIGTPEKIAEIENAPKPTPEIKTELSPVAQKLEGIYQDILHGAEHQWGGGTSDLPTILVVINGQPITLKEDELLKIKNDENAMKIINKLKGLLDKKSLYLLDGWLSRVPDQVSR